MVLNYLKVEVLTMKHWTFTGGRMGVWLKRSWFWLFDVEVFMLSDILR